MEPTTPAVHCAITSLGLLMMNSGEPMTGNSAVAARGQCGHRPGDLMVFQPLARIGKAPAAIV
jgi:hypothetical protein